MQIKKRNNFTNTLKLVIVLVSFSFLFFKLKQANSFSFIAALKTTIYTTHFWLFVSVALVLVLINWAFEALKWKIILLDTEKISFAKALKSVFSGVAIGFVTPNRIGEFAGKILFVKPENRVNATYLNAISSATQLFVTLLLGFLSTLLFSNEVYHYFSPAFIKIIQLLSVTGIVIVALFLFNTQYFFQNIGKIKMFQRFKINYTQHTIVPIKKTLTLMFCSLLRYFVFLFQYYLLFVLFDLSCDLTFFFALTAFYFLLITAIPTFFITEVGVRGSAALFVYSVVFFDAELVLSAAFCVWLINLAIPAIIGVLFVLNNKEEKND